MGRVHVKATRVGQYDSKLEASYAVRLELLRRAGEIQDWRHHAMRFRVGTGGDKTKTSFYTPDFTLVMNDGTMEHHDTKGRKMPAAMVRIRAAAELYPWFGWVVVERWGKDGFKYERFEN